METAEQCSWSRCTALQLSGLHCLFRDSASPVMLCSQLGCALKRTTLTTSQLLAGSQLPNGASNELLSVEKHLWIKKKWHGKNDYLYSIYLHPWHLTRSCVNATAVPHGPTQVIHESLWPGHCYQSTEPEAVGNVGTTQPVSRRKCWPDSTYTAARKNKTSFIGQKLNSGELRVEHLGTVRRKTSTVLWC